MLGDFTRDVLIRMTDCDDLTRSGLQWMFVHDDAAIRAENEKDSSCSLATASNRNRRAACYVTLL